MPAITRKKSASSKENNGVVPPRQHVSPPRHPLAARSKRQMADRTPLGAAREDEDTSTFTPFQKRLNNQHTPDNFAPNIFNFQQRLSFDDSPSPSPTTGSVLSPECEIMALSVLRLFEVGVHLRGKWWPFKKVLSVCDRLANFHPATPLVEQCFGLSFSMIQAVEGLVHENFESIVEKGTFDEREEDGSKHVYLLMSQDEKTKELFWAICADYSSNAPCLPPEAMSNTKLWMQHLDTQRLSLQPFMPHKLYQLCNFWHSTDAENLFAVRDGETAEEAARKIQTILREGVKSVDATKSVIDGLDNKAKTYFIDSYDGERMELKFDPVAVEKLASCTREKAVYLLKAITLMLNADAENETLNWGHKCTEAMAIIQSATEVVTITNHKTIQEWFRQFRGDRKFPNPLKREQFGIALFVNYPDVPKEIREFGNSNLQTLTVNLMQDHILHTIVPRLAASEKMTTEDFLASNGLKKLCFDTVHRWMRFLGFKHDKYRKGFYVDAHERLDVIQARVEYCIKLFQLELKSAVWVQLTAERVAHLKEFKRIYPTNNGIPVMKDGRQLFEFHVDDILGSAELKELSGVRFGGHNSYRLPEGSRPATVWGQDEVVCHEKQLNSMAWYGTDGQQYMRPKDLGSLIMISGVVSREAGWRPVPTPAQLVQINSLRFGKEYVAKEAAIAVFGSAEKSSLTRDDVETICFRWHIHPGANNDGYWTNNHTLLQLENICDVVAVMFPDHDHVICYDHSQGHCAKRRDGLDASRLNKECGGQQPHMHPTTLTRGTYGVYSNSGCRLDVGRDPVQHCVFREEDNGPSWMTPEQQASTKYDKEFPNEVVNRTLRSKKDIHQHLTEHLGVNRGLPANVDHVSLASLRDLAKKHDISLVVSEPKKQKGWVGAPKGALQLCIERGLVDLNTVKRNRGHYTMDGRKDKEGKLIEGTSLRVLLEECPDFKNEVSMLEWVALQYGWTVVFSPKCHPEVAGCGIEYVWSVSKNTLSRIPLKDRKGKDKFTDRVLNYCFSNTILNMKAVRGCARKQRQYLTAYLMLHAMEAAKKEADDASDGNNNGEGELLVGSVSVESLRNRGAELKFRSIQAARKMYKRHRGIALFNQEDDRVSFHGLESVDDWMRRHKKTNY